MAQSDFDVDGVSGDGGVEIAYNASGGFNSPPKNFTLRNINMSSGGCLVNMGAESADTATFATMENIELRDGTFEILERCHQTTLRNIRATEAKATGLALILTPDASFNTKEAFRPAGNRLTTMVLENVRGFDEFGAANCGIRTGASTTSKLQTLTGFVDARITRGGCNFDISGSKFPLGANNEYVGDFGGAFSPTPYGIELVVGDRVIDTNSTTPGQYIVTAPGA